MSSINERSNPIHTAGLARTQNIDDLLEKTRLNSLTNDCAIVGTAHDILSHLNGGLAKNLVNNFFKYTTTKCDICGIQKSKTIQLDRAHCNKDSCDRSSLLAKSIKYHFIDETTPIKVKDILITFIKYHKEIPLFILCKKCHREYDKK